MSEIKTVGNTNVSTNEVNIKWTINEFKTIYRNQKINDYILSSPFIDGDFVWFICLYPAGKHGEENYSQVYLLMYQENNFFTLNLLVEYQFSILKENDEKLIIKNKITEYFRPTRGDRFREFSDGKYCIQGIQKFLNRRDIDNYLTQNESLIIHCNIKKNFILNSMKNSKTCLCSHFREVLNEEKFADLEIIVGNTTYVAHKVVLASKSTVFMDILGSNQNNKRQIIEITNLKTDTVKEMLRYIYTNEVENINEEIASDLLAAADKYRIEELKTLCEEKLIQNLNVDNAIDALIFAEMHSAKNLKIRSTAIIAENIVELKNTENWQKLNTNLMTTIICELIKPK